MYKDLLYLFFLLCTKILCIYFLYLILHSALVALKLLNSPPHLVEMQVLGYR